MPRATRYLQDGFIYHLTHRCHNGEWFLRFEAERDKYRKWLRVGALRHKVAVLAYTVTSNHAHVVVAVDDSHAVAAMMQLAAGVVAQSRNRRKGHTDSVWEHPYQCTRVQDGVHLLNCLRYVDLNMVRAGKVKHPSDWRWCGYDELTGQRQRYRTIDQERLLESTGFATMAQFSDAYAQSVRERIGLDMSDREPCWTESVAVGDVDFVQEAEKSCSYRQSMEVAEIELPGQESVWVVREAPEPYSTDSEQESTC
jgi:putative transposase